MVDAQAQVARVAQQALVGHTLPVMVDGPSPEHDMLLLGRHQGQAPEIDGVVHMGSPPEGARPGDLLELRVTDADEVDLVAEPIVD